MITKVGVTIFALLVLMLSSRAEPLDAWNALNEKQHALLNSGKHVLVTEKIQDTPWPYFHIYFLVHATPMQAAAVFWDAPRAPHFIPHCLNVTVCTRPAANVAVVDYELQVPFFSNEVSKVRNILKSLPQDRGYEVSWNVLHSKYSKSGRGSFLVVPHEKESLICYSNFIDPGSIIATVLRRYAERQVQEVAVAIADQIEHEAQHDPELMRQQEEELKKALEN
ncbi:MAG: hypothetical protein QE493_00440 [Verrucomicrobiae bacterium]|nr:hypothetical protein [Verrucomicrobiae bacterium]